MGSFTINDGLQTCQNENAQVLEITSADENDFIYSWGKENGYERVHLGKNVDFLCIVLTLILTLTLIYNTYHMIART